MSGASLSPLARRIATEHAASAAADRRPALERFLSQGLPAARDEDWRYANLKPLDKAVFAPPATAAALDASLLPEALEDHARYVFIDGLFFAAGAGASEQHGLTVTTGRTPSADARRDDSNSDTGFALLNEAFAADGAELSVAAGSSARVEVIFLSSNAGAAYPRLSVRLGANARLSLIERHLAPGGAAGFISTAITVNVDDGATLDHYRLQQAGNGATWIDTATVTVGRDATCNTHLLMLGALSARSTAQVRLAQSGAALAFNAVAVADGRQVQDCLVLVDHQAPHTRTEENFRGIAGGRSRLGFNGKIIVREAATRADSAQSLRGLIAGAEAEIDLRPQLEIYTDDVRCSHGATTGKLDENMLFYLLSRGLAPEVAQRLLKWAFITDVVSRIAPERLRQQARQGLMGQMQDADALKELL